MDKAQHTVAMEETLENYDFGLKNANAMKTTDNVLESNKCNQCDYASSQAGNLRIHLKTHSGEKSNICNQCDYASSPFKDTFQNSQWRKVQQMQPM